MQLQIKRLFPGITRQLFSMIFFPVEALDLFSFYPDFNSIFQDFYQFRNKTVNKTIGMYIGDGAEGAVAPLPSPLPPHTNTRFGAKNSCYNA